MDARDAALFGLIAVGTWLSLHLEFTRLALRRR